MKNNAGLSAVVWILIAAIIIIAGWMLLAGTPDELKNEEEAEISEERDNENGIEVVANVETVHTVRYSNNGFVPASLTISAGETVTFVNEGDGQMWVASALHPTHEEFPDLDQLRGVKSGGTYTFSFSESGNYRYHNHLDAEHTGVITVE
ncbi:MAG: cupredoxin domain-containing protein [Candidatus Harrisonbacteria bacterium]|nr:cupredoxin domain-containing protein [Candidatus Harrisonbacteria bacterium]